MSTAEQLAQALRECAEAAWHKDSHRVHFDSTVAFGPHYNFCGLDGIQREEFLGEHDCIVWPCGSGRKWSAYCTYQGSLWFERFDTVEEAKAVCMELLAKVSPNDPFVKARAVLATHEAEKAAQSAVPGWCPGCTPDNCQGCGVVGGQDLSRKTAPVAPVAVPEGFALVPLRMTPAMQYVTEQEDWTWEDLLASAEAITEEQYGDIAAAPAAPHGFALVRSPITEAMHAAACKVLAQAIGLDGTPQRMLDAMLAAAAPAAPVAVQMDEAAQSLAGIVAEWVDGGIETGADWRSGLADVILLRLARFAAIAAPSPVLVRDVADMLGTTVAAVSAAFVALGHARRSTNMAVTGEEAVQVAAHLRAAQAEPVAVRGDLVPEWAPELEHSSSAVDQLVYHHDDADPDGSGEFMQRLRAAAHELVTSERERCAARWGIKLEGGQG